MKSVHTHKKEHGIRQIPPLDLPEVVIHRGHFVIVFPYSLFFLKGLWKTSNFRVIPSTEQLTERSGDRCLVPPFVFAVPE